MPAFLLFFLMAAIFCTFGRLQLTNAIGLLVGSIEPGFESRSVVPSDSNGAFAAPGRLLFVRGDRLLQQQFDLDRLAVTGEDASRRTNLL